MCRPVSQVLCAALGSLLKSLVTEKEMPPFVKMSFLPGHPLASELHAFPFQPVQGLAGWVGSALGLPAAESPPS